MFVSLVKIVEVYIFCDVFEKVIGVLVYIKVEDD